jgi:hypothetical protein
MVENFMIGKIRNSTRKLILLIFAGFQNDFRPLNTLVIPFSFAESWQITLSPTSQIANGL